MTTATASAAPPPVYELGASVRNDVMWALINCIKRSRLLPGHQCEALAKLITEIFLRELKLILDHELDRFGEKDPMHKGLKHARDLLTLQETRRR